LSSNSPGAQPPCPPLSFHKRAHSCSVSAPYPNLPHGHRSLAPCGFYSSIFRSLAPAHCSPLRFGSDASNQFFKSLRIRNVPCSCHPLFLIPFPHVLPSFLFILKTSVVPCLPLGSGPSHSADLFCRKPFFSGTFRRTIKFHQDGTDLLKTFDVHPTRFFSLLYASLCFEYLVPHKPRDLVDFP